MMEKAAFVVLGERKWSPHAKCKRVQRWRERAGEGERGVSVCVCARV